MNLRGGGHLDDSKAYDEKFLKETLGITTSHGISDEALHSMNKDINDLKKHKSS